MVLSTRRVLLHQLYTGKESTVGLKSDEIARFERVIYLL